MSTDTPDKYDDADQNRRHADLVRAIDNLAHVYDSIAVFVTYRDESGHTRSLRVRRGNFFANIGLIRYQAERDKVNAAIDEADEHTDRRLAEGDDNTPSGEQ